MIYAIKKSIRLVSTFLFISIVGGYTTVHAQIEDYVSEVRGDTVVVKTYSEMNFVSDALPDLIALDTNAPQGRVYELKQGGYYPVSYRIEVSGSRPLVIAGEDDTPHVSSTNTTSPPVIYATEIDGNLNSSFINFNTDVTIKNLITGAHSETASQGWAYADANGTGLTFTMDNVYMEHTNWVFVQANSGPGNSLHVKNSYFVNMNGTGCRRNGGVYDNVIYNTKEVIVENSTHVMGAGMIYKFRSFPIDKVVFNHNTFVNISNAPISTMGYQSNMIVANNLFVNTNVQAYYPGLDIAETDQDKLPTGIINIDSLNSENGIAVADSFFTEPLASADPSEWANLRKILVDRNAAYWSPVFDDAFIDEIEVMHSTYIDTVTGGPGSGSDRLMAQTMTMNSRTQAMFDNDSEWPFLNEGIWLESGDPDFTEDFGLLDNTAGTPFSDFLEYTKQSLDGGNTYTLASMRAEGNSADVTSNFAFPDWPIPVDLSYSNSTYLTGGYSGFPVGDLNWYPAQKEQWDAQKDAEYAALEMALNDGEPITGVTFPVKLNTPFNGQINMGLSPTFTWDEVSAYDTYEFRLASDSEMTTIISQENNLTQSMYSYTETLEVGTTYSWQVRGINEDTTGEWSEPYSFTTIRPMKIVGWDNNEYGQREVPEEVSNVVQIEAGYNTTLARTLSGEVKGWGSNGYSQLSIPEISDSVTSISANLFHVLALKDDSTVVAWGYNEQNQTEVPEGLTDVVSVAAGGYHSLALKSDGTVVAWGENAQNQTEVPESLTDVISISAGINHSLALKSDGTVVAWGAETEEVPVTLDNVVAISARFTHNLALREDGTVVQWGNTIGTVPEELNNVVNISAGNSVSYAMLSNGNVVSWGNSRHLAPSDLMNVSQISGGFNHVVALTSMELPGAPDAVTLVSPNDGQADVSTRPQFSWNQIEGVWGYDLEISSKEDFSDNVIYEATQSNSVEVYDNSIYLNTTYYWRVRPVGIGGSGDWSDIYSFSTQSINYDLPVIAWGLNNNSQSIVPESIFEQENIKQSDIKQIEAANFSSLIVLNDGRVIGWGRDDQIPDTVRNVDQISASVNHYLMLKEDGRISRLVFPISGPREDYLDEVPGQGSFVEIAAGSYHYLALREEGTLAAWGQNSYGQIDIPENIDSVTAISAGLSISLALHADGTVTGWGDGFDSEQLQVIENFNNITKISAKGSLALFLHADGTVSAVGNNLQGQTEVPEGLTDVVDISAGNTHGLALKSDGELVAWGDEKYNLSVVPEELVQVTQISAGLYHNLVVFGDAPSIPQVSLLLPENEQEGVTINPTFEWATQQDNENAEFHFEIAEDAGFEKIVSDTTVTDTSFTINSSLEGLTQYYWRVKEVAGTSESPWSDVFTFTTGEATSIESELPAEFALKQNYPNPFNPSTKLNFELPQAAEVTLEVYDMLGRKVVTLVNERKSAGRYTATFDASRYSSGMYIYRLKAGDFHQTKKMILIK